MFDLKEKAGKSCFPKMRPVDFKPTNQTRRLFIGQKLVNLVYIKVIARKPCDISTSCWWLQAGDAAAPPLQL